MKKLITALAILTVVIACNDPKDPPDDSKISMPDSSQVKVDSLDKELPKQ